MNIRYDSDISIQNNLYSYLWKEANGYSMNDVTLMYDRIVKRLESQLSDNVRPLYLFEKHYKNDYKCHSMHDLNFLEIKKSLDKEVIPDLKRQFTYEEALFELINRRNLIPMQNANPHYISNPHINAVIKIKFSGIFGNDFCYLDLIFPYCSFRISPCIK